MDYHDFVGGSNVKAYGGIALLVLRTDKLRIVFWCFMGVVCRCDSASSAYPLAESSGDIQRYYTADMKCYIYRYMARYRESDSKHRPSPDSRPCSIIVQSHILSTGRCLFTGYRKLSGKKETGRITEMVGDMKTPAC